jgi:hypothetical protein
MYDHHTRFGKAPCSWLNLSVLLGRHGAMNPAGGTLQHNADSYPGSVTLGNDSKHTIFLSNGQGSVSKYRSVSQLFLVTALRIIRPTAAKVITMPSLFLAKNRMARVHRGCRDV